MMRESKTLKGLFADPKPIHRKNFIKENMRSLRRMEQLFHTNTKSAKELKQTKTLNKHHGIGDNLNFNINGLRKLNLQDINESESSKLVDKRNSCSNDQKNRKKSTYVISNKKGCFQKVSRPSLNENVKKSNYYKNQINSKVDNRETLKASSEGNLTHKSLSPINTKNQTNVCSKSKGVQTLDTDDLTNLYSEGVIRYPSGRRETQKSKSSDTNNINKEMENNEAIVKDTSENYEINSTDRAKLKKEYPNIANKLAQKLSNPRPNHRVGIVPKYIKDRKEAIQKEQEAKIAAKNSDCPPGHIPVPDAERVKTLSMLKKNYQDHVNELNMLPIRTDTLRSQKRKMEIEKELTKLEEAIKIFSRPKVFVDINS